MNTQKSLCIGLALSPTWLSTKNEKNQDVNKALILSLPYYMNLAKRAEVAKLDFLFRPDALFLNIDILNQSPAFGGLDPSILIAAIAQETDYIGFISTLSTLFYPPFIAARQLQSLNWITQGRIGWNIVTALKGQENFGQKVLPDSQERYEIAKEFTQVLEALWQSYPHSSLENKGRADRVQQPIKPIEHQGCFFEVQGPLNIPAYPAKIPYFQAGASEAGRDFAASTADGIFAATPDIDSAIEFRRDIRERAQQMGRDVNSIRVLPGLSFYIAATREEAYQCFEQQHTTPDFNRQFRYIESLIGINLSSLSLDTIVTEAMIQTDFNSSYSQTHAQLLRRFICCNQPTVKALLASPEVNGSAHWRIIGTVDDMVNEIENWSACQACDGFIALPCGSEQSLNLFLEQVIPKLQEKGLFRQDYQEQSLWERLRG